MQAMAVSVKLVITHNLLRYFWKLRENYVRGCGFDFVSLVQYDFISVAVVSHITGNSDFEFVYCVR